MLAGSYVLTTNTDIYLSRGVIERLASRSLEHGILYRAARYDLKSYSDVSRVDWACSRTSATTMRSTSFAPPLFTNASGDFLLLDRDSYHRLRGFNEVYRVAKIHIDGNFCLKAYASLRAARSTSDFPVYHVGRGTLHAQVGQYRNRPGDAPWGDMRWKSDVIYVNGPEWGLAIAPERPTRRPGITAIDFDWNVVGPMVDLGRVVPPGAVSSEWSRRAKTAKFRQPAASRALPASALPASLATHEPLAFAGPEPPHRRCARRLSRATARRCATADRCSRSAAVASRWRRSRRLSPSRPTAAAADVSSRMRSAGTSSQM